jgi:hypothetical protein
VLAPVEMCILCTEVPGEKRAMMLLRLASESGNMVIVEGKMVAQAPVYIEEYPNHMIKPYMWPNNPTLHLFDQSCDQQQNPSHDISPKNDMFLY